MIKRFGIAKALLAIVLAAVPAAAAPAPAMAHGGGVEFLYAAADAYLDQRVQEVTDTSDVLLAMEWAPTVGGTVTGVRICLDLSGSEVGRRLPLMGFLWAADGTLMTRGSASEGITGAAPCFYDISFCCGTRAVQAHQRYVIGFWVRGGQYSYVPHGFDNDISNATVGHLGAPSNAGSTVGAGNGLYAYAGFQEVASANPPFPTQSWENSDYLISPRFLPDPH